MKNAWLVVWNKLHQPRIVGPQNGLNGDPSSTDPLKISLFLGTKFVAISMVISY